ncbi:hypothetical protein FQN60_004404 [Etheostoma spectabile]|uniref:Hox9 N-terminal activation domain-containing protein n=1 Tax=Etheostoma spectabile TaxID=54343 RepID=A0A5J5CYN7_9PERO|nr:hypothetical protein FQN60_004404 [Etheostoma spectabile]
MSISGTLSNYYVDSIISHESDELSTPARFPSVQYSSSSSAAAAGGRQPGGTEHPVPDSYPSCSFQPKPPVFSSSWSPFSPHHGASGLPTVYHPYIPAQHVPAADTRYLRSWLDCAPRGSESVLGQGQTGQVKLEPQLGHLGVEIPPKIGGQHQHETTTYILESTSTAARELSHHQAAIPRAGFEENKDICEVSEDKDGLDQSDVQCVSVAGSGRCMEQQVKAVSIVHMAAILNTIAPQLTTLLHRSNPQPFVILDDSHSRGTAPRIAFSPKLDPCVPNKKTLLITSV